MAFSKKKVEERKQWLSSSVPGTFLDNNVDAISYSDFINKVRAAAAWLVRRVRIAVPGFSSGGRRQVS